jgi:hypothetical protein
MKSFRCITLLPFLIICGCPLNSKVPLSEPDPNEFDKGLLGLWKLVQKEKDDEAMLITISKFNESEYLIVARKMKEAEDDKEVEELFIRMYLTRIGEARFWNFQNLDENLNKRDYTFGLYSIKDGDTISLRLVRGKLFKNKKPTTTATLNAAFKGAIGNKEFLQEEALTFRRLEEQ